MNTNLQNYYDQYSADYELIYKKPEWQAELATIAAHLQETVKEKNVLEVACGTGYWTACYAAQANSVLATDGSRNMLAIAQKKAVAKNARVTFQHADAFALPEGNFNACVAGCWWSHVNRSDQSRLLEEIKKVCGSGTVLAMFDHCFVEEEEGENTVPIARTDLEGNTYQILRLPDGSRHEIIKNFPTDSTLRKKLAVYARDIRIKRSTYFWTLTCVLK